MFWPKGSFLPTVNSSLSLSLGEEKHRYCEVCRRKTHLYKMPGYYAICV